MEVVNPKSADTQVISRISKRKEGGWWKWGSRHFKKYIFTLSKRRLDPSVKASFGQCPKEKHFLVLMCSLRSMLYHTILHCTSLHCTALHCTTLHYTALHCTALHCNELYCIVLYCTALYCTALYYRNIQ